MRDDALLDRLKPRLRALRRGLLAWYDRQGRDLPWRRSDDPYRIWLSEVMLQQTRVEVVRDYYERFLAAFPNVEALAEAHEDRVLKLWEGLGYYSRARNLHQAARVVVAEHGGRFPRSAADLARLPGVGAYSAGAIASIAFGQCVPAVDGNVKRVLARLMGLTRSIDTAGVSADLWALAGQLVPSGRPGAFNQALMDLGSAVCVPRRPRCDQCPLRRHCDAHAQGLQNELPVRTPKKAGPHYDIVAGVVEREGRILLGKRPTGALLGGLWELPGGKVEPGETHEQALRRELAEECGLAVQVGPPVASVDHAYSHFRITLHVYRCPSPAGEPQARYHTELRWVARDELEHYAFPAANRKLLGKL